MEGLLLKTWFIYFKLDFANEDQQDKLHTSVLAHPPCTTTSD